jgi:hypothetical protein
MTILLVALALVFLAFAAVFRTRARPPGIGGEATRTLWVAGCCVMGCGMLAGAIISVS